MKNVPVCVCVCVYVCVCACVCVCELSLCAQKVHAACFRSADVCDFLLICWDKKRNVCERCLTSTKLTQPASPDRDRRSNNRAKRRLWGSTGFFKVKHALCSHRGMKSSSFSFTTPQSHKDKSICWTTNNNNVSLKKGGWQGCTASALVLHVCAFVHKCVFYITASYSVDVSCC